jgi:tetratricopeptide (TPR) repeat protein/transcriptional regulator with XRE-family HTH domain
MHQAGKEAVECFPETGECEADVAEQPGDAVAAGPGGFGALLRACRERALLSQERLADLSRVSTRAIGDLERTGRRPRGESVRLLADALGLTGREREQFEAAARAPSAGARAPSTAARPPDETAPLMRGPVVPRQLPPDIADFVGRAGLVAAFPGWLARGPGRAPGNAAEGGAVAVCAISGKAGAGKSALAVHLAHRHAADFPDGQLYASLRGGDAKGGSPLDPGEVLGRFLRATGVDGSGVPSGLDERAALYRSRLAGKRMLVVLDDAADEAQVRPLLPGGAGCAVLLTSRARLPGVAGARLIHLDVLDTGSALDLLGRIAGGARLAAEPDAASAIVTACGRLPLAVRVAGARLAGRPHWPLRRMAAALADERDRLDALAHGDLDVRASLSLSYRELGPDQRRLFRLLGLQDIAEVPAWLAGRLLDCPTDRAEALLDELADAQLVDAAGPDAAGQVRYRLHDLTRAYARERARAEELADERQAALERVLGGWVALADEADRRLSVGRLIEEGDPPSGWKPSAALTGKLLADPLAWLEAEQAGLLSAIRQASSAEIAGTAAIVRREGSVSREGSAGPEGIAGPGQIEPATGQARRLAETAWRLAGALTGFFWLRGCGDEYRRACDLALTRARQAGDRRGEAWMLTALAWVAVDQLRLDEAADLALRARLIHREAGDRRGEAYATLKLACAHEFRGLLEEAAAELGRAQELYDDRGDDHGRAWVLHALGRVMHQQGRPAEAAAVLEGALTTSRRAGDRRVEILALQQLGLVHRDLGQHRQGVLLLLQALRRCRQHGDELAEGWMLQDLAEMRLRAGAYAQAGLALEHALGIFARLGVRRTQASVLRSLGELRHAQRRLLEARACLAEAAAIQRQLGLTPRLAQTLAALSPVQAAIGDHTAARRSHREARALLAGRGQAG